MHVLRRFDIPIKAFEIWMICLRHRNPATSSGTQLFKAVDPKDLKINGY